MEGIFSRMDLSITNIYDTATPSYRDSTLQSARGSDLRRVQTVIEGCYLCTVDVSPASRNSPILTAMGSRVSSLPALSSLSLTVLAS